MKEVDKQMLQIQVGRFWEVHVKREEIVLQIVKREEIVLQIVLMKQIVLTKQSHQSNSRIFNKIYSTT